MVKLSDLKLKERAKDCFAADKNIEKLFVTQDGNCFLKKNLAENHNRSIPDGKVTTIERKDIAFLLKKDEKKEDDNK